jgi:hypothetical protein
MGDQHRVGHVTPTWKPKLMMDRYMMPVMVELRAVSKTPPNNTLNTKYREAAKFALLLDTKYVEIT